MLRLSKTAGWNAWRRPIGWRHAPRTSPARVGAQRAVVDAWMAAPHDLWLQAHAVFCRDVGRMVGDRFGLPAALPNAREQL